MRGLLLDITPLRGREFRLLFLGQLVSFFDRLRGRLAGVRASIVSGGIMCVVGTGVALAFIPSFWRYDARHKVQS